MNNRQLYSRKPVLITTGVLTLLWIIVTILLIISSFGISQYQKDTSELFHNYMIYTDTASILTSDFNIRSDNVKAYASTGGQNFIDKYFEEETNFAKNHATFSAIRSIEGISEYLDDFESILANSAELARIEYHAMKLSATAFDKKPETLPEQINKYQLSPEELLLPKEQLRQNAVDILFGMHYSMLRVETLQKLGSFIGNTVSDASTKYEKSKEHLTTLIHREQNCLILEGLILAALFTLIVKMSQDRKKRDKELVDSLAINATFASCYDSVILIDAENNDLKIISHSDTFPPELEEAGKTGFYDYVHYYINEHVYPDDRNMLIQKFDLNTILNEVNTKKTYIVTYRVQSRSNPTVPVYYRNEFLPFKDARGRTQILCGGTVADKEIRAGFRNEMNEALVESLANIVENRDVLTGDHIKHTRTYVALIVKELRKNEQYPEILNKAYADTIISGSVLHDVGKIYISDTILNKPGKLTTEEFDEMKKHTELGSKVIADTFSNNFDEETQRVINNLVLHHHERWDGKGYPYGLKGEEIPLSARIMAVADVFDALVSKRSYKESFSIDTAFKILEEEKGTHFDSAIVDAFFRIRPKVETFLNESAAGSN